MHKEIVSLVLLATTVQFSSAFATVPRACQKLHSTSSFSSQSARRSRVSVHSVLMSEAKSSDQPAQAMEFDEEAYEKKRMEQAVFRAMKTVVIVLF
jgi:hypothetical protein